MFDNKYVLRIVDFNNKSLKFLNGCSNCIYKSIYNMIYKNFSLYISLKYDL